MNYLKWLAIGGGVAGAYYLLKPSSASAADVPAAPTVNAVTAASIKTKLAGISAHFDATKLTLSTYSGLVYATLPGETSKAFAPVIPLKTRNVTNMPAVRQSATGPALVVGSSYDKILAALSTGINTNAMFPTGAFTTAGVYAGNIAIKASDYPFDLTAMQGV